MTEEINERFDKLLQMMATQPEPSEKPALPSTLSQNRPPMQHALGIALLVTFAAIIVGMTVNACGWRGAAAVWGGSIALTAMALVGLQLLAS